ncbi:DUF2142 domain-containing protein [Cellulomonas sp. ATA003]|uniref:DUF2142 domain-containing protein n=1 Tax=Cellulomonas sp. ATA003 TaxID=3073064 RepID=UPI00287399F3|nr:DUF2142 domain-containing protein [Cellulomonas sp. ATA003]WNB86331.1 DUF2142 domain-containing protein [Cellulomonas sp. ATA003]
MAQSPTGSRTDSRVGATWPWVGVAALLMGIVALWSLAMPLMASPDEGSHVVKAAAVARGQWSGTLGPPPTDTSRPGAATVVELPNDIAQTLVLPNCYAFQPDQPADCAPDLPGRTGQTVAVETFAGQYPPLYYLLVGWPSLLLTGEAAVYGMRLASALISVVMVTWGAYRLRQVLPRHVATWGCVAALTPMCFFLFGTVNPNGWEIATAFSFWTACLALVVPRGRITTGALVHAGVAGALLVNIRDSSPFWALAVVVVVAVVAPAGRLRQLVRHRLAPWVAGLAVLSGLAMAAWTATHGGAVSARGLHPRLADQAVALLEISGSSYNYLQQMIGNFGWLDTPRRPSRSSAGTPRWVCSSCSRSPRAPGSGPGSRSGWSCSGSPRRRSSSCRPRPTPASSGRGAMRCPSPSGWPWWRRRRSACRTGRRTTRPPRTSTWRGGCSR